MKKTKVVCKRKADEEEGSSFFSKNGSMEEWVGSVMKGGWEKEGNFSEEDEEEEWREELKGKYEILKKKSERLKKRHEVLEKTIINLTGLNKDLKEKNAEVLEKDEKLIRENKRLRRINTNLSGDSKQLSKDSKELLRKVSGLSKKNKTLKEQNKTHKLEITNLEMKLRRLEFINAKLKKNLKNIERAAPKQKREESDQYIKEKKQIANLCFEVISEKDKEIIQERSAAKKSLRSCQEALGLLPTLYRFLPNPKRFLGFDFWPLPLIAAAVSFCFCMDDDETLASDIGSSFRYLLFFWGVAALIVTYRFNTEHYKENISATKAHENLDEVEVGGESEDEHENVDENGVLCN